MKNSYNNYAYNNHQKTSNIEDELSEKVKEKIITILLSKNLLEYNKSKSLDTLIDVKKYMAKLYSENKITLNEFIEIGVRSGGMKLGNYLVLKGYISKETLNEALSIQKQEKNKRSLGEILLEEKTLYNTKEEELTFPQLNEALEALGIRRLGEYLANKGIIKYEQISYYLDQQKNKKIPFGKLLVQDGKISQKKLNTILTELGLEVHMDELSIDEEIDYGNYAYVGTHIWG
ncbi:MAG: hypothetical protein Q8K30_00960 [Candidatus Gracilibacteria bacterium]|nr:hypothetical protein [Candidatus Gracilibacteria bacterium]